MTAKTAIKKAFWELLRELPLNQITVILLCERANVNRQTFYYYYQNVVDLLKEVLFAEIYDEVATGGSAYDTWKHGFLTTTRFLHENHSVFLNIYHSNYFDEINQYLTEVSSSLLRGVINDCIEATGIDVSEDDKQFMVHYYRVVFNSIMTEWVKDGMKLPPEVLLSKVEKLVDGTICSALQRFALE